MSIFCILPIFWSSCGSVPFSRRTKDIVQNYQFVQDLYSVFCSRSESMKTDLFVCFCSARLFVRSDFIGAKARDPHVPLTLCRVTAQKQCLSSVNLTITAIVDYILCLLCAYAAQVQNQPQSPAHFSFQTAPIVLLVSVICCLHTLLIVNAVRMVQHCKMHFPQIHTNKATTQHMLNFA